MASGRQIEPCPVSARIRKVDPVNPDGLPDPKAALVDVARRSRSRAVRERIVPNRGSTAKQGRDYNSVSLSSFGGSGTLKRLRTLREPAGTVAKLGSFSPVWRTGV